MNSPSFPEACPADTCEVVRHRSPRPPLPPSPPSPPVPPRRVSAYAIGVLLLAFGVCGWLLAGDAELPPLSACVVLAVPLTLCMNRFVFFPNEVGATAEAATLFAAIVGFRSESPLLGPVLLALLVGLLDGRHWERRAFIRMSYNSGSQALTVLAAACAFGLTTSEVGASAPRLLAASALAALVYVGVESGFGVVLVVLLGESVRTALRHQVPVNALAVPLALFGAVAVLTVAPTNWWLVGLVLVPTAFVPELALVGVRRPSLRRRVLGVLALASCALVVLVVDLLVRGQGLGGLVGIVALALLLGADLRLPSWRGLAPVAVVVLAAAAGIASVSWLVVVCATAIAVAFGTGRHRVDAMWSLPLALAAATVAAAVGSIALPPGLPILVAGAAVVVAAALWGSVPWPSRLVGPWSARQRPVWPIVALGVLSSLALLSSLWSFTTGAPIAGRVATAAAAATLACAMSGVRQWRFAPRARRRDRTLLTVGGVVVAGLLVPDVARSSDVVAGVGVVATVVAVSVAVGCARSVQRARRAVDGPAGDRARVP